MRLQSQSCSVVRVPQAVDVRVVDLLGASPEIKAAARPGPGDQAASDQAVAVLALNVLTEIKMGGLANLRFLNLWPECLIGLIPTRMGSSIRRKSMLLAKVEGNHVLVDLAEANAPVVGLEVRAAANRAREDLEVDSNLVGKEVSGPREVRVEANRVLEVLVGGSDLVDREVPGPVAVLVGKVAG